MAKTHKCNNLNKSRSLASLGPSNHRWGRLDERNKGHRRTLPRSTRLTPFIFSDTTASSLNRMPQMQDGVEIVLGDP